MKISPRELREAQIPTKAFGFDRDVVDALLERAADTVEGLIEENRQLFEALERTQAEAAQAAQQAPVIQNVEQVVAEPAQSFDEAITGEPAPVPVAVPSGELEMSAAVNAQIAEKEALINKTLMLAQKTADETLRSAKEEADQLVLDSENKARELVEQATAEAEHLTGSAKEEAELALANAKDQAQQMVSSARTEATEIVEKAQIQANEMYKAETDRFVDLVERLTSEREQLVGDIEILQNFDSEHRAKLQALVEEDLSKLEARETFNFDELPQLPDMPKILEAAKKYEKPVVETVAHSELPSGETKSVSLGDDAVLVEAQEVNSFDDVDDEDIEVEDISDDDSPNVVAPAGGSDKATKTTKAKSASSDPFADFVDSQVSADREDSANVVAPAGEPEKPAKDFNPGLSMDSQKNARLDDDDFFASLRDAVNDETPLGESSDDDGDSNGIFKNIFDK